LCPLTAFEFHLLYASCSTGISFLEIIFIKFSYYAALLLSFKASLLSSAVSLALLYNDIKHTS
jgi:hypothetical protein